MDFRNVIYENVKIKKKTHFITNISIYTVTDILKFYEIFVLSLKNSHVYIPLYKNKNCRATKNVLFHSPN